MSNLRLLKAAQRLRKFVMEGEYEDLAEEFDRDILALCDNAEQPTKEADSDIEDVAKNCERAADENDLTQMRSMLRCAAYWLRQDNHV